MRRRRRRRAFLFAPLHVLYIICLYNNLYDSYSLVTVQCSRIKMEQQEKADKEKEEEENK